VQLNQLDHLRATLADLMKWFEGEGLRAAVIGGVAAGVHGRPRLTEGVDAVVFSDDAIHPSNPRSSTDSDRKSKTHWTSR